MLDRATLIAQMAKALAGQSALDPSPPSREARQQAEEALQKVEVFLGADVEDAKEILTRVLEDVS